VVNPAPLVVTIFAQPASRHAVSRSVLPAAEPACQAGQHPRSQHLLWLLIITRLPSVKRRALTKWNALRKPNTVNDFEGFVDSVTSSRWDGWLTGVIERALSTADPE